MEMYGKGFPAWTLELLGAWWEKGARDPGTRIPPLQPHLMGVIPPSGAEPTPCTWSLVVFPHVGAGRRHQWLLLCPSEGGDEHLNRMLFASYATGLGQIMGEKRAEHFDEQEILVFLAQSTP